MAGHWKLFPGETTGSGHLSPPVPEKIRLPLTHFLARPQMAASHAEAGSAEHMTCLLEGHLSDAPSASYHMTLQ